MSKHEQGTQEWLDWRKTMITASEVPVILGISPYTTKNELWMQKKGYRVQKENGAMRFGKINESVARDRFIELTNHMVVPGIAEHTTIEWMMASLDGITFSKNVICEIKSNNKAVHEEVKKGIIPQFHWMQVQTQMECADLDKCYYVSDNAWDTIYTVIKRDKKWFDSIKDELQAFHESLDEETPPELSDRDIAENTNLEWCDLMKESQLVHIEIKRLTGRKETLKQAMIELSDNRSTFGGGGTLRKKFKVGSIDYKAIEELKYVDLEEYRKPSSQYWTLEYEKDTKCGK